MQYQPSGLSDRNLSQSRKQCKPLGVSDLVHRSVAPSIEFEDNHLYTAVERSTVGLKCLTIPSIAQESSISTIQWCTDVSYSSGYNLLAGYAFTYLAEPLQASFASSSIIKFKF